MMKAALTYYRDTSTPPKNNKITLGDWNAAQKSRVTLRTRKPKVKAPEIQLTPAEKSLMRLVKNGQVGALIAFHAPAVDDQ